MADMIRIISNTDTTVSLYDPTIPVRKSFNKKGAVAMVEKDKLLQMYFTSNLEDALRAGLLVINDKDFLIEAGYITEENEKVETVDLTPAFMKRCIGAMPLAELTSELKKMSNYQIQELVEFAIANHKDLRMDRIELLGKVSGKNILKAIELLKADQEV
jgi:hypothetical protein